MRPLWWVVCIGCLLAACRPTASAPPPPTDDPNGIGWTRSPETVVFRAEIVQPNLPELAALNVVPDCTVYGDNRVVWRNDLNVFETETLIDRVSDEAIRGFIEYLTVYERIYTYQTPEMPAETDAELAQRAVQRIQIFISGIEHRADDRSGWDAAWFGRVLEACKRISSTPVLFLPNGGWLTVRAAPYDIQAEMIPWAHGDTLRLAETAAGEQPVWLAQTLAVPVWRVLQNSPPTVLFLEGEQTYQLALQVPGVTRDAPPASG